MREASMTGLSNDELASGIFYVFTQLTQGDIVVLKVGLLMD
jgi:hypothetical protein